MLKKLITLSALSATIIAGSGFHAQAAESYKVKSGDSLWTIGKTYGVSVKEMKKLNNKNNHLIFPGESIQLPDQVANEEKELLARLVHAEAKGEPYEGKVAVATVVLNRVDSDIFPDSIKEVIYETSPGGIYQFSPVGNGEIDKPANEEALKAAEEAIAFRGDGNNSLYFFNPDKTSDQWIRSREVTTKIGKHVFAQ
ncbi:Spore cortex-lytic enzyme precursor [Bacillus sp. THAF10]|uniref:cell wall hydrolase n=1 Tax=Bacillus sp. THAF10 TaxID=2587848 RepID=UPI0012683693|nr:cell wall hydrolase [Bacillus sp. THAF10]QFT89183.1 Spore cortex-lytic enzyme precursor [Bacillus sp. THAF10]